MGISFYYCNILKRMIKISFLIIIIKLINYITLLYLIRLNANYYKYHHYFFGEEVLLTCFKRSGN